MWIATNDVERVVDWFYKRSDAHFLGVFVAGDRKFDSILKAVIANRQTIDIITGPCIDVVLFSTADLTLRGAGDPPIRHISNLTKWTPTFTREIANATTMSTNDIASAMKLGIDDLPSLVLLRRQARRWDPEEVSRLTLKLRGAADIDFLIEFFRAFRKSLERLQRARSEGLQGTEQALVKIESHIADRMAETAVVEKRIARISRDIAEIQRCMALDAFNSEHLLAILRSASSVDEFISGLSTATAIEATQIERSLSGATLKRLIKAQVAQRNAERRLSKLRGQMPNLRNALEYVELTEQEISELQVVLDRFERKLSYALKREQVFKFLGVSEKLLDRVKRIVRLAAAIKTGGASLL